MVLLSARSCTLAELRLSRRCDIPVTLVKGDYRPPVSSVGGAGVRACRLYTNGSAIRP